MAQQTLNLFTQYTSPPSLLSLLFFRDGALGTPQSRAVALHRIAAAFQGYLIVKSMTVSDPVALSPSIGDLYVVNPTGAGAWLGQDNDYAIWDGSAWVFTTAAEGWRVYDENTNKIHEFSGSAWAIRGVDSFAYDNATSGLTATDPKAAIDEIAAGYGSIYTQQSDSAALDTIGTTAQNLTFTTNGESFQTTVDATNNRITVLRGGIWRVDISMSFSAVAAGDAGLYLLVVQKNAADTVIELQRELSGSGDTGSSATSGLLNLAANDIITVEITSDEAGDTDDINIVNNELTLTLLRAT